MRKWPLFALLFVALFFFGCPVVERQKIISEVEARAHVEQDLRTKFPNAEVREIISATTDGESWQIKARVTYNFSSPCPVRLHVFYDYPRKGFIISPPEYITHECRVCVGEPCIIAVPEEAIIASHTLAGTSDVKNYITNYANAKPTARFYSAYFDPATNTTLRDVWIVSWYSPATNYAVIAAVSYGGVIEKTWKVVKE